MEVWIFSAVTMINKDKYFVYDSEHKCWTHRTPLKCFVNPILRFIQFYTDAPFVIYSECEENNGKWHFIKYGFGKIKYFRRKDMNNNKIWIWIFIAVFFGVIAISAILGFTVFRGR